MRVLCFEIRYVGFSPKGDPFFGYRRELIRLCRHGASVTSGGASCEYKILAIKNLRALAEQNGSELGLKDAKDRIELLIHSLVADRKAVSRTDLNTNYLYQLPLGQEFFKKARFVL